MIACPNADNACERGAPFYPNLFQNVAFPLWTRPGGWLAGGINWHFLLMWPLMAVGLIYIGYVSASGEWKKLVFRPSDVRTAIEMQKYYLPVALRSPSARKAQRVGRKPLTPSSCCSARCQC